MSVLAGISVFLGIIILAALVIGAYNVALGLWDKTAETRRDVSLKALEVEHGRVGLDRERLGLDRERLRVTERIQPDANGVWPLLWDGHQALDPNRGIVFSIQDGAQVLTEAIAKPEQLARLLRAAGGWPSGNAGNLLAEPERAITWPDRVPMTYALEGQPPSYRSLALGVTVGPGGPQVVRGDMCELVHIAVGGSIGWGKSVFLRILAYQLALSVDPVDLALVDLEAVTFAPFAKCGRLLWPLADTEVDALTIFLELTSEMDRRKELFTEFPGVDSLGAYNAVAAEPLTPVVCLTDEATALLGDKEVEGALRTLALRARKFGLWLVLGGQDWKATSLDTALRNQLSSRVQFRALSASQSRVLLQRPGAENLDARGRCLAVLPGRDVVELQAPYITPQDILAAVANGGPQNALPGPPTDERIDQVYHLDAEGLTPTAIAEAIFGYKNANRIAWVRAILDSDK